jgi:hypothetical protein
LAVVGTISATGTYSVYHGRHFVNNGFLPVELKLTPEQEAIFKDFDAKEIAVSGDLLEGGSVSQIGRVKHYVLVGPGNRAMLPKDHPLYRKSEKSK